MQRGLFNLSKGSVVTPSAPVAIAAPTGGVVDDVNDTFSFTRNPAYTVGEHEYSLDWGVTWTVCSSTTVSVGDVDAGVGQVRVRVRALNGNPVGAYVNNETAFTRKLLTPAAPTNGVVDDGADTFRFVRNPEFTISQHEFSLNGGSTWSVCSSETINVGNNALAVGDVQVRVMAVNGNVPSASLTNQVAFTVKAVGCDVWNLSYNNPWPTTWQAPVVITEGGTYTGNYLTTDEYRQCVRIKTTQPVVLLNCNFKGPGWAVSAAGMDGVDAMPGANVTILNSRHFGIPETKQQRFVDGVSNFKNLVIENCDMYDSAGIKHADGYSGDNSTGNTIRIRYNRAFNIYGLNKFGQNVGANFYQCDKVYSNVVYKTENGLPFYQGVPHVEIAWNEVINRPNDSHVEDNINIHNSRGATYSPMKIHHNLIYGAYYKDYQAAYSGSGMIIEASAPDGRCGAWVDMEDNVVVMSNNNTYGFAGGNNSNMRRNVGIGKATFDEADCVRLGLTGTDRERKSYPSDFYLFDFYNMGNTYNNSVVDHISATVGQKSLSLGYWRNPRTQAELNSLVNPVHGTVSNLLWLPTNPITEADEQFYMKKLRDERNALCIRIGVIG